ncbi:hypothetical protein CEE86_14180, partial [Lactobacillus crispatus]
GQLGAVLDHARRDLRDVRDLGAAQAEGVTGAHLLRLGAECEARARGQRRDARRNRQHDGGPANATSKCSAPKNPAFENGGHDRLPSAPPIAAPVV